MRTIQAQWDSFEAQVLPKGCSDTQRTEMKKSFYAGASAILAICNEIAAIESEASGVVIFESLHQETRDFANNLKR